MSEANKAESQATDLKNKIIDLVRKNPAMTLVSAAILGLVAYLVLPGKTPTAFPVAPVAASQTQQNSKVTSTGQQQTMSFVVSEIKTFPGSTRVILNSGKFPNTQSIILNGPAAAQYAANPNVLIGQAVTGTGMGQIYNAGTKQIPQVEVTDHTHFKVGK